MATTQVTEAKKALKAQGLDLNNFSIKAKRRRVLGDDGKKHTEFLPGLIITHYYCNLPEFLTDIEPKIHAAGFDTVYYVFSTGMTAKWPMIREASGPVGTTRYEKA